MSSTLLPHLRTRVGPQLNQGRNTSGSLGNSGQPPPSRSLPSKSPYWSKKKNRRRWFFLVLGILMVPVLNLGLWLLFMGPDIIFSRSFGSRVSNKFVSPLPVRDNGRQKFQLLVLVVSHCKTIKPSDRKLIKAWNVLSELSTRTRKNGGKISGEEKNAIGEVFEKWKRSLDALLNDLIVADYGEDKVALRVVSWCDEAHVLRKMRRYLQNMTWVIGPMSFTAERHFRWGGPSHTWSQSASSEAVFVVQTGFSLSPNFYRKLKGKVVNLLLSGNHSMQHVKALDVFPRDSVESSLQTEVSPTCQLILPSTWQRFSGSSPEPRFQPRAGSHYRPKMFYKLNQACSSNWRSSVSSFLHSEGAFSLRLFSTVCHDAEDKEEGAEEDEDEDDEDDEDEASENLELSSSATSLPRFNLCGTRLQPAQLATSMDELPALLSQIHVNRTVIAVMSSEGFEDMLQNWLCFIAELDISNYVVVSDSLDQATRMVQRGHSAFHLHVPASADRSLDYGTVGYKQFILERTKMVLSILQLKFNVLLADVDAVWLSNPFHHMRSTKIDIFAQLEPSGHLCGGFLYLRCTPAVIEVWRTVTNRFGDTVREMMKTAPAISPGNKTLWLKHYEHLHEQRYLNFYLRLKNSSAVFKGLDMLLFPNGRDYFVYQKPQKVKIEPVVIHNNYIVGKQNKTRRFRETGLWRLGADNVCLCLQCRVKQESNGGIGQI